MKKFILLMLMFVISACATNNTKQEAVNLTDDVKEAGSCKWRRHIHKGPAVIKCTAKQAVTE